MNWQVVPYFSLDDVYNQITKEDIVVDYIQQCENVFAKFNVLNPHVETSQANCVIETVINDA